MAENKVQFNLKNVHYAKMSVSDTGEVTYATPVHVPGAVSLALEQQGETTPFYADGIVYYTAISDNGYQGGLEMARFPDSMLTDIWGMTEDATDHVVTENANAEPAAFALLFQIDGDRGNNLYVLYNCKGTRPGLGGSTTTGSKQPQTRTSTITATPLSDGTVQAHTNGQTPSTVKNGWFTAVYKKKAT